MTEDDKYKPPVRRTGGDHVHSVVKAAASAIPVLGGAASELFSAIVTPPLEKRRRTWMNDVGQGLRDLEAKGCDINDLSDNDEFIDIVMSASTAAMKTASEEKRQALKNVVLNTAAGRSPEESLAQVFVSWVDQFTDWHLKILKLFQDPIGWAERQGTSYGNLGTSSLSETLTTAFPDLSDRRPFYDQVWRDLNQRGLVNTDSLSGMMTASGATAKRTSDLGGQFLAFIES